MRSSGVGEQPARAVNRRRSRGRRSGAVLSVVCLPRFNCGEAFAQGPAVSPQRVAFFTDRTDASPAPEGRQNRAQGDAQRSPGFTGLSTPQPPKGAAERSAGPHVPQSQCNLIYHLVFSTKGRQPWLDGDVRSRVHQYIGGVIRRLGGVPLIVNGTSDHVHILAKLAQDNRPFERPAGYQSKLVLLDSPVVPGSPRVPVAGRLRRIHGQHVTHGDAPPVHRPAGRASPQVVVQRRAREIIAGARNRI